MKVSEKEVTIEGLKGKIRIKRIKGGIPHISADHELDLHYGLGFMHGLDRQLHMWLLKLIGKGQASENLQAAEDLIETDKYMRWINLGGDAAEEVENLPPEAKEILQIYCKGVNDAIAQSGRNLGFRLVGYKPVKDPWIAEDCCLIGKMIGFIGLAQMQGDNEKFIIQLIRNGIEPEKIKELFPSITEEISDELINIIKKVSIANLAIAPSVSWLPRAAGSNNWAIRPNRTASGKAIFCGDLHLDIRLPSIWYCATLQAGDFFSMGASLPGIPGIILGRTPTLAWSPTLAPMDCTDYFIEEVKDKKYRRGDEWIPFTVREEIMHPKKKEPITLQFYENEHGVIEGDLEKDGYYLCFATSGRKGVIAETFVNMVKIGKAKTAEEAMDYFAGMIFAPFNWVIADSTGNIGYQMGGLLPEKADNTSGLLPYYGWDKSHDWKSMIDPKKYPRALNPEQGFFITANEDTNPLGDVSPLTLPIASYRADRIANLLKDRENLTVEDMKEMQYDLHSIQAEKMMTIIRPLLPSTENAEILKKWDFKYDLSSVGATIFENIYHELIRVVFGENGMGSEVIDHMFNETPLFAELYGFFDEILLKENSSWFGNKSREELFKTAIERGVNKKAVRYGKTRRMHILNMFFGGKLPKFLGFDYGPIELFGSRATISQGERFKFAGRQSSFAPSFRMICDFSEDVLHINVPGGPSDGRFSKYYKTMIKEWLTGEYTVLKP